MATSEYFIVHTYIPGTVAYAPVKIRLLHTAKNPLLPYGEQNLYRLYKACFQKAGFQSRLKQHLPRHLLPYRQNEMESVR